MRFFIVFSILITITSCGLFKDWNKPVRDMGYNPERDTSDFKPYDYVIIRKGMTPEFAKCKFSDSLNVKISIKGFENTVYLPITVLYDSIQLSFSDTSIREVVNGAMRYRSYNSGYYQRIGTNDATHTKILFGAGGFSEKNTRRAKPLKKDYLLIYFFCVEVKKEGKIYTIPSRYYFLTD